MSESNVEPDEPPEGQVSEVTNLEHGEDTPISPTEQVGGYPPSESGDVDEGEELGPDADQFRDRDVR